MTNPETLDDTSRVRVTWARAMTEPGRTSTVFYANLFRIDPSTKPLFVNDLELQGRKLIMTLNFIVDHLDDPDTLMPAAIELAKLHVGFGVLASQYGSVGTALIDTLKQLLGAEFSKADEQAWDDTYAGLSAAMISAAYPD